MNKEQKAAVVEEVAAQIKESGAVFAVDYRGITVPQAADLREKLTEAGARFRVVKNTLTEIAADRAGVEPLKQVLEGPTAFTFVREDGDVALAAKALAQFKREHDVLDFKGGVMNGEALSVEQLGELSRLPARDVLHGQLVGHDRLADHRPGARPERADQRPCDPARPDRGAGPAAGRRGARRGGGSRGAGRRRRRPPPRRPPQRNKLRPRNNLRPKQPEAEEQAEETEAPSEGEDEKEG